jgi:hypothetical protein
MNELEKFNCRLALELHIPIVEVLNLPAWEIRRWQEYFSENMFTEDRVVYQLALIANIIYNVNSEKPANISDFIIGYKTPTEEPEVVNSKLETLRGIIGGMYGN